LGENSRGVRALLLWLLLTLVGFAEPGVTLLLDSRQAGQRQLALEARRYLVLLRKANDLEEFQLNISSADWANPAVAAQWRRDFGLTSRELPALAIVRRQGNRLSLDNLVRQYKSPKSAAEGAFKCLKGNLPNLVHQDKLITSMELKSQPAGCRVMLDGEPAGSTPCQLDVTPGSHHLVVLQDNYHPCERRLNLELGQTYRQEIVMIPQGAFLRVESGDLPVQFLLEGGEAVTTPCMLDVTAGLHRYQVSAPGYCTAQGEVRVEADRLTSLKIAMEPLRLRVQLANFAAYGYQGVNHRSSGTGWRRVEWVEPYEIFLDQGALHQKLQQGLNRPDQFDSVTEQGDCVISAEIRSSQNQIIGTLTLADAQGRVRQTLTAARDMPFMTFDEQGSAQLRAGEVLDDLLTQVVPAIPQYFSVPKDQIRPAQAQVQIGPPP